MPYFPGLKTVFVHIPKTAGTSIIDALAQHSQESNLGPGVMTRKHETILNIYQSMNKQDFGKCFKFSVVRNPWDRTVSWYVYSKKLWKEMPEGFPPEPDRVTSLLCKNQPCDIDNCIKRFLDTDFNTWVKSLTTYGVNGCSSTVCPFHITAPQYLFVVDGAGHYMINEAIRYEKLHEEWATTIPKWLNINKLPDLGLSNIGDRGRDYREYYSDESKETIEEVYKKDIEYFKYEF